MTTTSRHRIASALLLSIAAVSFADAQVVRGTVIDFGSRQPISRALVSLLDSTSTELRAVTTDDQGKFQLPVPYRGYVALQAKRLGYGLKLTTWLAFELGDTVDIELDMERSSVSLEPVVIRAEADWIRRRKIFGMDARTLGGTIMTPSMVAAHEAGAHDFTDIVRSLGIPGLEVVEMAQNTRCVASRFGCLLVFIDDIRVPDPADALDVLPPSTVDFMIYLRSGEAGVLFGTGSEAGVLLVYTKNASGRGRK